MEQERPALAEGDAQDVVRALPPALRHRVGATAEALCLLEPYFMFPIDARLVAQHQQRVAMLGRTQRDLARQAPFCVLLDLFFLGRRPDRLAACLEWLLAHRGPLTAVVTGASWVRAPHGEKVLRRRPCPIGPVIGRAALLWRDVQLLGRLLESCGAASIQVQRLRELTIQAPALGQRFDAGILALLPSLKSLELQCFASADLAALPACVQCAKLILPAGSYINMKVAEATRGMPALTAVLAAAVERARALQRRPGTYQVQLVVPGAPVMMAVAGGVRIAFVPAAPAQQQPAAAAAQPLQGAVQHLANAVPPPPLPGAPQPPPAVPAQPQAAAAPALQQAAAVPPPAAPAAGAAAAANARLRDLIANPALPQELLQLQDVHARLVSEVLAQGTLRPLAQLPGHRLSELLVNGGSLTVAVDVPAFFGAAVKPILMAEQVELELPASLAALAAAQRPRRRRWRLPWQHPAALDSPLQLAAVQRLFALLEAAASSRRGERGWAALLLVNQWQLVLGDGAVGGWAQQQAQQVLMMAAQVARLLRHEVPRHPQMAAWQEGTSAGGVQAPWMVIAHRSIKRRKGLKAAAEVAGAVCAIALLLWARSVLAPEVSNAEFLFDILVKHLLSR